MDRQVKHIPLNDIPASGLRLPCNSPDENFHMLSNLTVIYPDDGIPWYSRNFRDTFVPFFEF